MIRYLLCIMLMNITVIAFSQIKKEKDIIYTGIDEDRNNLLNIYYPKKTERKKDVIIFIHGGSWNSGDKKTYWWLGRNFAKKDVVTVLINYPLHPEFEYESMPLNCAKAVQWVYQNINKYGGNSERIFLMGHSAGGHLVALIAQDQRFFNEVNLKNPVKGVILNDPFGLDLNQYLINHRSGSYIETFTNNPDVWKKASPINYINKEIKIPYLIFTGEKTYPTIINQAKDFEKALLQNGGKVKLKEIENKKHIGMIIQMFFKSNKLYKEILKFIAEN